MDRGTEAFPDLGEHCEHDDCHQLDFLPFKCNGCHKVFCLEHRTYKAHGCPNSEQNSRMVVVCEVCSMSIEKKAGEEDTTVLQRHEKSRECDATKKHKPKCPAKRCKEVLTFSNTSTCKTCNIKVCLKHRFPSDHACKPAAAINNSAHPLFSVGRNSTACRDTKRNMSSSRSIKVC